MSATGDAALGEPSAIATDAQAALDRYRARFVEGMRVIVVAGVAAGVLLVGVGSRLAMLLLRITSPDRAHGVVSDDGFTIGEVTLAGSYNLLMIGAAVGIIGAAVYRAVSPRLIGPTWFRRATTGLAAAAVAGSMLVHADGIDFTLLQPTWLAIGLFVALPGVFGTLIGPVVDAVARPGSWTRRGSRRWLLPVVAVAFFPPTIVLVVVAAGAFGVWVLVTEVPAAERVRATRSYGLTVRSLWLAIAVLGLAALVNDTREVIAANESAAPAVAAAPAR